MKYEIDREGCLLWTCDEFSPEVREAYLGRPVFEAMTTGTLRDLWFGLIGRALDSGHVTLYCSSDDARAARRMRLTLTRTPRGTLHIETHLQTERQRTPSVQEAYAEHAPMLRMCAWCHRVQLAKGWVQVEEALRTDAHQRASDDGATHGICPRCLRQLKQDTGRRLRSMASASEPDPNEAHHAGPREKHVS